jgi:hypothetical protein
MSLTLDAGGVAELLSYRCRDGRPNAAAIRKLARAGKIPGPIDPTLGSRQWRWARARIERYITDGIGAS